MQQNAMFKEYLDVIFRRRWWVIVPALVGVLVSVALYLEFPKSYKANTKVTIRPQTISRQLLNPIVEARSEDLVNTISAEINSEQYSQLLDDRLHIIGTPNGPRDLAELTDRLEHATQLTVNQRNRYFDLTVSWNDPRTAAAVANELASIYMTRTSEYRKTLASDTVEQLRTAREVVQKQLAAVNEQVETFRNQHKYELADFQATNTEQLRTLNSKVDEIEGKIRTLRSEIANIEIQLRSPTVRGEGSGGDPRADALSRAGNELQQALTSGLTDEHPRIKLLRAQIAKLREQLGIAATAPIGPDVDLERAKLEQKKKDYELEIVALEAQRQRYRLEIDQVNARLQNTPEWQIEFDKLTMRQKALQSDYDDARKKEQEATSGAQVEEMDKGESFVVLNTAFPPKSASWPDLKLFLFCGLAVGVGLGVALVLLLEVFDQSFKSEEQLAASIDLPILAVIPDLARAPEQKPRPSSAKPLRKAG